MHASEAKNTYIHITTPPLMPHTSYKIIHQAPPSTLTSINSVRKPAPTRSPVVTGPNTKEVTGLSPLDPAEGSPLLVPPSLAVTGGGAVAIRDDWMTSSALICSPTPVLPSHVGPRFHLIPQVLPGAPTHCPAAACAEALSFGKIFSVVNGAIFVVAAIHRARYALKDL